MSAPSYEQVLPSVGMERTTTLELQKNKESMKRIFKEARGVREGGGKALKRSVRIGGMIAQ
jgi:hypothetical protein